MSLVQFVAGLGTGSASLVWHVSGWTLGSISGFSTAASRILQRSIAARQADMCAAGHHNALSPPWLPNEGQVCLFFREYELGTL